MKICILSRDSTLYSTNRLVKASMDRGHQTRVVDPLRCYMNIATRKPSIHYAGEVLENFDAVIPRIGHSITFYGTAVVRQFEMMGVYSLNESVAISRARDKLRCLQLLAREGIGLPVSGFAHSPDDSQDLIRMVGGAPLIVKLLSGTHGTGVVLTETTQAAESVIEAFRGLEAYFLVQQFIKESRGADVRCFVVGKQVVAAMLRQSKDGEFRSNLHKGGQGLPVKLSRQEIRAAVRATQILGLSAAGVDIIRSNQGPMVLEVNASPGLEGIEKTTGTDVAGKIIEYIEKHCVQGKTKTKGKG
jgi:ribosomal protein S6--L-glutamate ligase